MKLWTSAFAWWALAVLHGVSALTVTGPKVLVVIEELDDQTKYSKFFGDLESRGFEISVQSPQSETVSLFRHGARAYDHLLLLPPKSKSYGPNFKTESVLEFVENDGNVIVGLSGSSLITSQISSLLLQFDIHLPPYRSALTVDHFLYDTLSDPEKHSVLVSSRPGPLRNDTRAFFGGDGVVALPRPVGQSLGPDSPLIAPVLTASETAYTYDYKDGAKTVEDVFAPGTQTALISALQARNSARVLVLGSTEMIQDEWLDAKVQPFGSDTVVKVVNREFAKQLSMWAFKEVGVLRVESLNHWQTEDLGSQSFVNVQAPKPGASLNPEIYRVKSDVGFALEVSEWVVDHWEPFSVPVNDRLQLEFSMLSPFHRLNLVRQPRTPAPSSQDNFVTNTDSDSDSSDTNLAQSTTPSALYTTSFRTPDQHGIFSFVVNYKRPFLTTIHERRQVTVRHFAHDEWPRSWRISGAWPWIAGLWSTVGGFLVFCAVWLYSAPPPELEKVKAATAADKDKKKA